MSATTRIVISLVCLATSLLLVAAMLGFFPDRRQDVMRGRMRLCESLAMSFSTMASRTNSQTMEAFFVAVAERNPEIVSIGLRKAEGILLLDVGGHAKQWQTLGDGKSSEIQIELPMYAANRKWGSLEVRFLPIYPPGWKGIVTRGEFTLTAFMAICMSICFSIYLRRVLRQLNPSKVIPSRVREAFDSLAEGILVLDTKSQVVLANRAFEQATGRSVPQLMGMPVKELPFVSRDDAESGPLPWEAAIGESQLITGRLLGFEGDAKTFSVSSAPILDEQGTNRGALASFEDVTQLKDKKEELLKMVQHLQRSSVEIERQNRELESLANHDHLTGCLNRRSFFEQFEQLWKTSQRYETPLAAIMVDIDHFKAINDAHGHSMGDEVLQRVAGALQDVVRDSDVLCRYGGEEFAVVLPHTSLSQGIIAAERLRAAVSQLRFSQLSVTASLGVSARCQHPADPQALLDQADKCLYVAKRNGRNQVVNWEQASTEAGIADSETSVSAVEQRGDDEVASIPYHAVTALVSALAYRDQETAAHSRRVADLCVAIAEGLLSLKDSYTLEMAALLHDIGKIGVPDAILLKPGQLSPPEWEVMKSYSCIGVEIIHASFASPVLTELVKAYSSRYDETENPRSATSTVPVGSRILAVADAYDSMTSDQAYRQGRSHADAIAELRRHAGTQFDPELVERLDKVMQLRLVNPAAEQHDQSTDVALNIGLQIGRLVAALDRQDLDDMRVLASRLKDTASKYGASQISAKATELELAFQTDGDLIGIVHSAAELLDLCRSTQCALLDRPRLRGARG